MKTGLHRLWTEDSGQDIAEYAVMLAVILVIVVGTIRLIGSNANNVFSSVASSVQSRHSGDRSSGMESAAVVAQDWNAPRRGARVEPCKQSRLSPVLQDRVSNP